MHAMNRPQPTSAILRNKYIKNVRLQYDSTMLHTHLHLHFTSYRITNKRCLQTFQNAALFRTSGSKYLQFSRCP